MGKPLWLFAVLAIVCWAMPARAACTYEDQRGVCVPRDIYFMPGIQAVGYAPRLSDQPYIGGGVQLAPFQWSHNNERFGPSQGAIFLQASLLESPGAAGTLALYEVGFSLSFERNASRNFLIPFFGTSVGAVVHSELEDVGYAYALAGLHIWWDQNLVLDLDGGYHFPFDGVDEWRGPRAQLSAKFSLW